jgi:hypothetical protein
MRSPCRKIAHQLHTALGGDVIAYNSTALDPAMQADIAVRADHGTRAAR